jgi:hypothetical protein
MLERCGEKNKKKVYNPKKSERSKKKRKKCGVLQLNENAPAVLNNWCV